MSNYSKSDLRVLSSTKGIIELLSMEIPDVDLALERLNYLDQLVKLQTKLIQMQQWITQNNQRLLVIFEGGEFSGKGPAIRALSAHLNPRSVQTVALPKPKQKEMGQWYFQRYVNRLPQTGEMVLFDRSWYNRAVVEPVNGFCSKRQYKHFMEVVNDFEEMLRLDGIIIIKIFLSITKEVQAARIDNVLKNPLRRWEFTKVDKNAQRLWGDYKSYQEKMFKITDTPNVPWKIINSENLHESNLNVLEHVLSTVHWK